MNVDVANRTERPVRAGRRKGTAPSPQAFRREGEYWTIEYAGTVCRLRDFSGLRYLACLLGRPGQQIPATELIAHHRASAEDAMPPSKPNKTSDDERARVCATRAIRAALRRIGEHQPVLVEHLNATIHTGARCTYMPDERLPIAWDL
jgi:hypothetical protein